MSTAYDADYRRQRAALAGQLCELALPGCRGLADSADHVPPLAHHVHQAGSGCCILVPACIACQKAQGGRISRRRPRLATSRQW